MTTKTRVFWGFLAGIAIVLVKILGPDRDFVNSLFAAISLPDITFYAFISIITISLGAISGAFCNESDRVKLLLFCASVPALLSTATAEKRDMIPIPPETVARAGGSVNSFRLPPVFATPAYAQIADNTECREDSFFSKFAQSAQNYLSGTSQASRANYVVIVYSSADLAEARSVADRIAAAGGDWNPYVGCHRPGNPNYPVIVGERGSELQAADLKGRFDALGMLPDPAYLSNYAWSVPIYQPHR